MIISLSRSENLLEIPLLVGVDVMCFFHYPSGISADESLWWEALTTSLRLKRSVLILESGITTFPQWDESRRWQTSDNWSWLSPRSLSVLSEAYQGSRLSYQDFKTFLKNSK